MIDNLRLFDDIERTDQDPAGYSSSSYKYLNESARPRYKYIREVLENWFDDYHCSDIKRNALRSEFASQSDKKHFAIFFELYLYTLCKHLGFDVEVEPKQTNNNKPDFLLTDKFGNKILMEATSIYSDSEFSSHKQQEKSILDHLDNNLDCPDYFLYVDIKSSTQSNINIPYGQMKRHLQREINKLNYENVVAEAIENHNMGFDRFPLIHWTDNLTLLGKLKKDVPEQEIG